MFVSKAAVLGGGTMGGEIAQVIAAADIPVVVKDIKQEFVDAAVEKSREVTKSQLDKLVSKEKLTQEAADARLDEVMGLITGATDYSGFGDVDIVIEAVPEKMEIKKAVYKEIDEATPGHAILASNTSSLSITEIGRETLRPNQVVGLHFFWPASVMPLVEIIAGEDTSRETVTTAYNFAQTIRKQPITCREVPGFVVNRILTSAAGEIWRVQEEAGLSIKKIDEAVDVRERPADGPVLPRRHERPGHRAAHRPAHAGLLRRSLLRARGHEEAGRRREAGCQDRRRRFLQGRGASRSTERASPTPPSWGT